MRENKNSNEKFNELVKLTCNFFNIPEQDLKSVSRKRNLTDVRFHLYKYAYDSGYFTFVHIGMMMGRHHSTIMTGLSAMVNLIETDDYFKYSYSRYYEFIKQHFILPEYNITIKKNKYAKTN